MSLCCICWRILLLCCRLGKCCSYACCNAVLLKVGCALWLSHTSVTSQSCTWNDMFFMKVIQMINWVNYFQNSHSFLTLLKQHWVSSLKVSSKYRAYKGKVYCSLQCGSEWEQSSWEWWQWSRLSRGWGCDQWRNWEKWEAQHCLESSWNCA